MSKCEHKWEALDDDYAKCCTCGSVTKSELVLRGTRKVKTCPICYDSAKNREGMIDQICPGCHKRYSVDYSPPKSYTLGEDFYMGFPLEDEEDPLSKAISDIKRLAKDRDEVMND